MDKLVLRGIGISRRPLYSACPRWGFRWPTQQRLAFSFSCSSRLAADATTHPKLSDTPCRTRFAPSPTGYLHLGSLRTALFNYLLARASGGQFILRIEDTDQTRLVPDAEEKLYEDLRWAGLSWDEGPDKSGPYGPYRQSERLPLYHEHADKLVGEAKAYRCFCSPEALEERKRAAHESGESTLYPGTCRGISPEESDDRARKGEEFAIRFKSAEESASYKDLVYNIFKKKDAEEDFIIMKRDGFPTYHFANVVDDHHMKITHVLRGAEWLISTPKHIELYRAFGWEPPQFGHLGLLVGRKRQKLSKRDNSSDLGFYKRGHILPATVLNFVALLGWRAPPGTEVMSLRDMVDKFSLNFTKGDIVVSMYKVPYFQNKHLQRLVESNDPADAPLIQREFLDPIQAAIQTVQQAKSNGDAIAPGSDVQTAELGDPLPAAAILHDARFRPDLVRVLLGFPLSLDTPADRFASAVGKLRYYLWQVPEGVLERAVRDGKLDPVVAPPAAAAKLGEAVAYLRDKFHAVVEEGGGGAWHREALERVMRDAMVDQTTYCKFFEGGSKNNSQQNVYLPLRWALLGLEKGLPISATMEILGRDETLRRLDVARRAADKAAVVNVGVQVPTPSSP